MKYEEIIRDLKNKVYHPVYVLMGEEAFYIDRITDFMAENILDEAEREFNQTIVYGRDTTVDQVVSLAKRFPMMANHQVVIVKEAQNLKKIEDLLPYVENSQISTILVLCYKYKKLDKRKTFTKTVGKKGVVFDSVLVPEYKIADWIASYLKSTSYSATPQVCNILANHLGADLSRIANELDKLMLVLPEGAEITADDVEKNVGISKTFNVFELNNALGKRDVVKANMIAMHFSANKKEHPFIVTITTMFNFFSKVMLYHYTADKSDKNIASVLKVNPYFVKDYTLAAKLYSPGKIARIISWLREYDLKAKGVNNSSTDDGDLLKELLFKMMH